MFSEPKMVRSAAQTPESIAASWTRCAAAGLDERDHIGTTRGYDDVSPVARAQNARLLAYAEPAVENLYEQVMGTTSAVVVADRNGVIIFSRGDPDFLNAAGQITLRTGACWAEKYAGTNAIGTSLAAQLPVCVRSNEHFLKSNRFISGCASPIFDPSGALIGILAIYSAGESEQLHTLGFVRTIAVMVENRMLARELANEIVVYFHPESEYIGTIKQCIAVFGRDGRLLGTNTATRQICALAKTDDLTFNSLFDFPWQLLLDQARTSGLTPHLTMMRDGRQVFLIVNMGRSASRDAPNLLIEPQLGLARERTVTSLKKAAEIMLRDLDTGDSAIRRAVDKASTILGCDIPLLIEGESGVGKELFTRAFHNSGPGRHGPFVAVNCASIPEGLIESELFGYEEGAFTGAKRKGYEGKIFQANGGTLFLDEIGDMPLALQGRLLRVLQERYVTPLGSSRNIPIDISVICATHRNIRGEVTAGRFREDLYYRLNGLRIMLPSLRQREDLEQLVLLIARSESGGKPIELTRDATEALRTFSWPGNIRQLQMVLRTALALLRGGTTITLEHLPDELFQDLDEPAKPQQIGMAADSGSKGGASAVGELARLESVAIKNALEAARGNISEAARKLGISRKTLYRKLGKL